MNNLFGKSENISGRTRCLYLNQSPPDLEFFTFLPSSISYKFSRRGREQRAQKYNCEEAEGGGKKAFQLCSILVQLFWMLHVQEILEEIGSSLVLGIEF